MAKENLKPVQSGLKGTNTQEEVVALLRWGISAEAPGKARGEQREPPWASLNYQRAHFQTHSSNLNAVKDFGCNQAETLLEGQKC